MIINWKWKKFQGYALTPETYVASIDADPSSANSFHESVDNMTKSASFPIDKDPTSLSMKLARAAEIVYLSGDSENLIIMQNSKKNDIMCNDVESEI